MPGIENFAPERTLHQQRILTRAQFLALQRFQLSQRRLHFLVDLRAELAAHIFAAGLGLDSESRRHRQSGVGHLGQSRTFAAQHIFHLAVAVGMAVAEEKYVLFSGRRACRIGRRLVQNALRDGKSLLCLEFL